MKNFLRKTILSLMTLFMVPFYGIATEEVTSSANCLKWQHCEYNACIAPLVSALPDAPPDTVYYFYQADDPDGRIGLYEAVQAANAQPAGTKNTIYLANDMECYDQLNIDCDLTIQSLHGASYKLSVYKDS